MKKTLATLAILSLAVPAMAAKVYVDFDQKTDFTQYKTYSIGKGTPADELTQKKIDAALRAELEKTGLTEAEKGKGDLVISTHASSDKQVKKKGGNVNVGVSKRGKRGNVGLSTGGGGRIKEVESGSLIVDMVDASSDALVWQATASGSIKGDPQKAQQQLEKALADAFKKYPPQ